MRHPVEVTGCINRTVEDEGEKKLTCSGTSRKDASTRGQRIGPELPGEPFESPGRIADEISVGVARDAQSARLANRNAASEAEFAIDGRRRSLSRISRREISFLLTPESLSEDIPLRPKSSSVGRLTSLVAFAENDANCVTCPIGSEIGKDGDGRRVLGYKAKGFGRSRVGAHRKSSATYRAGSGDARGRLARGRHDSDIRCSGRCRRGRRRSRNHAQNRLSDLLRRRRVGVGDGYGGHKRHGGAHRQHNHRIGENAVDACDDLRRGRQHDLSLLPLLGRSNFIVGGV